MKKARLLSMILVIALAVTCVPMTVSAAPVLFDQANDYTVLFDGTNVDGWTGASIPGSTVAGEGSLAVTNRNSRPSGVILNTKDVVASSKTYVLTFNAKSNGANDSFILRIQGVLATATKGVRFDAGTAAADGWYTHTFEFTGDGKAFDIAIYGGNVKGNSVADFYIDNFVLFEKNIATPILAYDFNVPANCGNWQGMVKNQYMMNATCSQTVSFPGCGGQVGVSVDSGNGFLRASDRKSYCAGITLMFHDVVFKANHSYVAVFDARSTTDGEDLRMYMYKPGTEHSLSSSNVNHNHEVTKADPIMGKNWATFETNPITPIEDGGKFELMIGGHYLSQGAHAPISDFDIDNFRVYDITDDPARTTNLITGNDKAFGFDTFDTVAHGKELKSEYHSSYFHEGSTITWQQERDHAIALTSSASFAPTGGISVVRGNYSISGMFRTPFSRELVVSGSYLYSGSPYAWHRIADYNKQNIKVVLTTENGDQIIGVPVDSDAVGTAWTEIVFDIAIPEDTVITDIKFEGYGAVAPAYGSTVLNYNGTDYTFELKPIQGNATNTIKGIAATDAMGNYLDVEVVSKLINSFMPEFLEDTKLSFEFADVSMVCTEVYKEDDGAASAGTVMVVIAKKKAIEALGLNVKEELYNGYAHVTNKHSIHSGFEYDTPAMLEAGKTYTLTLDMRCASPDEDYRLAVAYQGTSTSVELTGGGRPYSDKWETYNFTFKAAATGKATVKIWGGYMRNGVLCSVSDFDVDNVIIVDADDETMTNLITGTKDPVTFEDNIDGCYGYNDNPVTQQSLVIHQVENLEFYTSDEIDEENATSTANIQIAKKLAAGTYTISGAFKTVYDRTNVVYCPRIADGGEHLRLNNYNMVRIKAIVMLKGGVEIETVASRRAFTTSDWTNISFEFTLEEDSVIKGIKFIGYDGKKPDTNSESTERHGYTIEVVSDRLATVMHVIKEDGSFVERDQVIDWFEVYMKGHVLPAAHPFNYSSIKITPAE